MTRALMAAVFLGGIALAGCGDDSGSKTPTGGDMHVTNTGDMVMVASNGDGGDGGGAEDFEVFVLGLINTQTSDSTLPTAIDGRTFTDSMDPSKFSSLF